MIPAQVGMGLRTKIKKEAKEPTIKKGQRDQKEKEKIKKWEKKREMVMLLSFSTLVLQSSTIFFMIELGLYIPVMGFLKMP